MTIRCRVSAFSSPGIRAGLLLFLSLAGFPFSAAGHWTCTRGLEVCNGTWDEHIWYHFKSDSGFYVPLTRLEDRAVTLDGDLADWGDLRDGGFVLDQHLCGIMPTEDPSTADAALVKLMRDEEALYLAARVHDESIVASPDSAEPFRGDSFRFYLDVRLFPDPPPARGDHDWVVPDQWVFDRLAQPPGVFMFEVAPPAAGRAKAVWKITPEVPGAEIACRAVPKGYAVEMRMPIAGMLGWLDIDTFKGKVSEKMKKVIRDIPKGAYDNRIEGPFGFDVAINDVDAGPEGEGILKPFYVWGDPSLDIEDHHKHPRYYGVADPKIAVAARSVLPRLLDLPAGYSIAEPGAGATSGKVFQSRAIFSSLGGALRPTDYTSPRCLVLWGRSESKDRTSRYDEVLQVGFEWHKPLPDWYGKNSAREVYEIFPDLMKTLIDSLDLEREGLEKVKQAREKNDIPLALEEFARARPTIQMRARKHTHEDVEQGFKGVREGFLCYEPMRNYPEHFGLKRMGWSLSHLAYGWKVPGKFYALKWLDIYLRSWLIERFSDYSGDADDLGEIILQLSHDPVPDRGEGGRVSDALILLLHARVTEIANALLSREIAPGRISNIHLADLLSLWRFLSFFPDFRQAREWQEQTAVKMARLFNGGLIYPDGTHSEQSNQAHRDLFGTIYIHRERLLEAGIALPEGLDACLHRMWESVFHSVRPDGRMPLTGDSSPGSRWNDTRPHFQGIPLEGLTPVMQHITSNGKQGVAPEEPPSRFLDWGGQLISRSGWNRDAHWSFFDIGPYGTGRNTYQIHLDRLHLSISAYGRDLLVDAGVHGLSPPCRSSQAHNVVLIDGRDQAGEPLYAERPVPDVDFKITPEFDFARGHVNAFQGLAGQARHTRALMYVRGRFWVVVDRIETDRPRDVTVNWQFHPDCRLHLAEEMRPAAAGGSDWGLDGIGLDESLGLEAPEVIGGDFRMVGPGNWRLGQAALRIKPVDDGGISDWKLTIRDDGRYGSQSAPGHGQTETQPRMNRAVYEKRIDNESAFAWLLLPAGKVLPAEAKATMRLDGDVAIVTVTVAGQESIRLTMPLAGNSAPALGAGM